MPSKVRDNSAERRREKKESSRSEKDRRERDRDRDRERDRDKDRDRDRDRDRDKEKERHRSHRKASVREKTSSRTSISPVNEKRRSSMPGKVEDAPIKSDSKSSLPYPTFSKEHSREKVGSGSHPVLNVFTPPATDLNVSKDKLPSRHSAGAANDAPPSPPLTEKTSGTAKWKANIGRPVSVDTIQEEEKGSQTDGDGKTTCKARLIPKTRGSNGRLRSSSELGTDSSPTRKPRDAPTTPLKTVTPVSTIPVSQRSVSQPTRTGSPATTNSATETGTNLSSEATSIAPEQPTIQRPGSKIPPAAVHPDGPTIILPQSRGVTPMEILIEDNASILTGASAFVSQTPGPPPPPPAPIPVSVPKVDYLLQHGGLNQSVTKNLLLAGKPMAIQQAQTPNQPSILVANLFEPYVALLDDYEKVISKNGSLAVATGYRSVARRLLDRLEAVFARDISSEACQCPMCEYDHAEDVRGVSWGEVLELVSGRKDLPNWPPFAFTQSPVGLGISLEFRVPMQKLDIDVPEEYREHYIRQSRKTKQSVDKWLSRQSDDPSSPPEEVDEETLTFAILTHLPAEQRPIFKDLLGIVDRPIEPPRRIPTPELEKQNGEAHPPQPTPTPAPAPRVRPPHIAIASQAIQRLYRLAITPRDSEAALFLLHNPALHNALATLAAISSDEWDILISGRFDGFLRSGAEDVPLPEHIPSRGTTPYRPPTRGATPGYGPQTNGTGYGSRQGSYSHPYPHTNGVPGAQYGAPIAFDEETELATLAEIERDVYAGMEALEDAFEALHNKAEIVRRALRERSAGLAAAAQRRRGVMGGGIEVRMDTPASGIMPGGENGMGGRWDAETDDGLGEWDGLGEIEPDDSASNISSARRRRPKRRNERRTPALIEEEDEMEDDGASEGTGSPRKR